MKAVRYILFFFVFFPWEFYAQQAYFVDGYHGGIYGHYPIEWQTQFMVDLLNEHPEWCICLEIEPETWDTVKVRTPKAYHNFKESLRSGRIEFTNPTYAQPYCYNISGESIIRQFEYGMQKIKQHFPEVTFQTYAVEEPCFTSCLPSILKQFGFRYAVLKCPDTCWGGYVTGYGNDLVNWIAPDGSSILTVPRYACELLEENSTWQTTAWNNSASYIEACRDAGIKAPVGMCYQDAGWKGGPWLGSGDKIKNNSVYVTWREYIEKYTSGTSDDDWHLSQDDLHVSLMWGSQILQQIARDVREGENRLVMAEKLAAMAFCENGYTDTISRIDDAWRTLLLAQHHDAWIVPYNRLDKTHTWAEKVKEWTGNTLACSDSIIDKAMKAMVEFSGNVGEKRIRIYNTTGICRKEIVRVFVPDMSETNEIALYDVKNHWIDSHAEEKGQGVYITFEAEVPAFGYATYSIREGGRKIKRRSSVRRTDENSWIVENDVFKVVFDASKGGAVTQLIAKKEGNKDFVSSTGRQLLGELKGYFYEEGCFHSSVENPAEISVVRDNFFEVVLKIEGKIATHPFTQLVRFRRGRKSIDFNLQIDWIKNVGIGEYQQAPGAWQKSRRAFYDDRFKLNILFPVSLNSPVIYKDAPFDVCESRWENTHYNSWDSIKHNVVLHWVDLYDRESDYGFAVYSDHTTSYAWGNDYPFALTAQYSGNGLWGVGYPLKGCTKMTYALVPHQGCWDEAALSSMDVCRNEALQIDVSENVSMQNRSFIQIEKEGYQLSAVKMADGSLMLRIFNAEGTDGPHVIMLAFPIKKIMETDLNGAEQHEVDWEGIWLGNDKKQEKAGGKFILSMPRFGFKTFKIEIGD